MDLSAPKLPPKPIREQAKVLFAYEAQNDDELTIREGDIINVLSKEIEDQGWFKGELNGKIGVFPDNFVELIRMPSSAAATAGPADEVEKPPRPGKGVASTSPAATITTSSSASKSPAATAATTTSGMIREKENGKENVSHSKSSIFANLTKKASSSPKVTSSASSSISSSSCTPSASLSSSTSSSTGRVSGGGGCLSKPDVVPLAETGPTSKSMTTTSEGVAAVVDTVSAENGSADGQPTSFTGIEMSSGSKLSHITATRPKGPSNRRPPSYIAVNNNSNTPANRDAAADGAAAGLENGHHQEGSHANGKVTSPSGTPPTAAASGTKGSKEEPPWMIELRRTQEAKKQGKDNSLPSLTERQSSIESADGPASLTPVPSSPAIVAASTAATVTTRPVSLAKSSVTAANRASGDFSNRIGQFNANSSSSNSPPVTAPDSTPVSILKPMKPVKPGLTSSISSSSTPPTSANVNINSPTSATTTPTSSLSKKDVASAAAASAAAATASSSSISHVMTQSSSVSSSTSSPIVKSVPAAAASCPAASPAASVSTAVIAPSSKGSASSSSSNSQSTASTATTTTIPLILDSVTSSLIADLQREVRMLRESVIPKADYDDLTKQVHELKEAMEQQKQSQGKIVKELINDLAEERKKLAMLTIDVDRLRKLSTTV